MIDNIHQTIDAWKEDISKSLSSDVDPEKFFAAITTALVMNPKLARECTPDSIKQSCIKAAYDGLRPDGKEGALVAYYNKDEKALNAQWMPMVFGVRKKAKDHDNIFIIARAIYEKDKFLWSIGDEEKIEHEPAAPEVDPGKVVGSYAIFRRGGADGEILHREVMRKVDIDKVRNASKAPNSPAWNNWYDQMAMKAAVNRGSKSVPMSDAVLGVISRDNDFYEMRDITPGAVPLENRFAGARGEGFQADNIKALPQGGQVPMDTVGDKPKAESEVQRDTTVKATSSAKAASAKPASDDAGAGGSASTESGRPQANSGEGGQGKILTAADFKKYASSLARMASVENVKKADAKFWADIGGGIPAKGTPGYELGGLIFKKQSDRAAGKIEAEGLLDELNEAIEKAMGEAL